MNGKRAFAVIGIIFFSIVLCISCIVIGYTLSGGTIGDSDAIMDKSSIRMSNVSVCGSVIPDIYQDSMRHVETGNLDSRTSISDTLRANTDSALNSLKLETDRYGIKKYYNGGSLVRMDIPSGINAFNCERSYYFSDDNLYLADYHQGTIHEKLYFSSNVMYRFIAKDYSHVDNGFGDANYCFIGNFALNEAQAFK